MRKWLSNYEKPSPLVLYTLIALLPVAGYFLSQVWWVYNPFLPSLERKARQLAGFGAIDCGSATSSDSNDAQTLARLKAVDACIVEAFKQDRRFIGRKSMNGMVGYNDTFTVGAGNYHIYTVTNSENLLDQSLNQREAVYHLHVPTIHNNPWPELGEY